MDYTYKRASNLGLTVEASMTLRAGRVEAVVRGIYKVHPETEMESLVKAKKEFDHWVDVVVEELSQALIERDEEVYDLEKIGFYKTSSVTAVEGALVFTDYPFIALSAAVSPEHFEAVKREWNAEAKGYPHTPKFH